MAFKTSDIQEILIRSANDLIDLDAPNYQFVAARLLLFSLRKAVYNGHPDGHPPLLEHVQKCIEQGVYDPDISQSKYTEEEWDKLNSFMDHDRDYLFTYAGIRQVTDKYLVQDRSTGEIFETPQFMYMMVAATLFRMTTNFIGWSTSKNTMTQSQNTDSTSQRRSWQVSEHRCVNLHLVFSLMLMTPSIVSLAAIWLLVTMSHKGLVSALTLAESVGSTAKIRGGEVQHTGVVPFLKKFESTVRCCTQNGIRGGSATVHFPIWHQEIEDILVLKNNKGTEDNRVRKLDYSIQISKLFYERFIR